MKHLRFVYSVIIRYWALLLVGFVTMTLFALMQGISITLLVPLFDNVFVPNKTGVIYNDLTSFWYATSQTVTAFLHTHGGIWHIKSMEALKPLWEQVQQILSQSNSCMLLYALCGVIIVIIILRNIFYFIHRWCFTSVRAKVLYEIRNNMFNQYMSQSLAFFHTNRVGDSLVRMVGDVDIIAQYFINVIFSSLRDLISVFVAAYIAIMLNSRLFLWTLALLPAFSIIVGVLGKKIKKNSKRMQKQASSMYSNVEEILNSMPVVKAFTREPFELQRYDKLNRRYTKLWRNGEILQILTQPLTELNTTVIGAFLLVMGGSLILNSSGNFTLGNFSAFLIAVMSMLHPIKTLTSAYTNIRKALISLQRIGWVLDLTPQVADAQDAVAKTDFTTGIELRAVRFAYEPGKDVIHDVSLSIRKGQKVGLVGSSGSGKTTLVNLINRLYDLTGGEILIDGVPIRQIRLRDLHALFGLVTQDTVLLSDTIAGNIRYGPHRDVTDEQLRAAARIANADEYIEQLPEGYNTMLLTKGHGLSGGQRQRLCIARAVVGDPPILIFDEATSALDTEAERKVQQGIEQATRNRTVIMIAHRLSTVLSCDQIVVMDKGRVVAVGRHQELLASCSVYKRLYELQFESSDDRESPVNEVNI